MNNRIVQTPDKCCGCAACVEICPTKAIDMAKEHFGAPYAIIDDEKCIGCGRCGDVCTILNGSENLRRPIVCYAAACKGDDIQNSSSGGIFPVLARSIINRGGHVYGAVYIREQNRMTVKHICSASLDDIDPMRGSKYTQSSIVGVYHLIEEDIENELPVLFCGTPCQCNALRLKYQREATMGQVVLVDIVCHGVTSGNIFADYISYLERKNACVITSFNFRDKSKGWGRSCSYDYTDGDGNSRRYVYPSESSYYTLFEECILMRSTCFTCPFAQRNRTGDITIGDYWGIRVKQPELLKVNGGYFDEHDGISLLLINTDVGRELIESCTDDLHISETSIDNLEYMNPQLYTNISCDEDKRNAYSEIYKSKGYEGIEKFWIRERHFKYIIRYIWNRLPERLQDTVRGIFK